MERKDVVSAIRTSEFYQNSELRYDFLFAEEELRLCSGYNVCCVPFDSITGLYIGKSIITIEIKNIYAVNGNLYGFVCFFNA